jgi:hypothetical protein
MKTPMQELLEWVRRTMPMDLVLPQEIEEKIQTYIPKEREVIRSAYMDGQDDVLEKFNYRMDGHLNSLHYYNRTFKNSEQ